LPAVWCHPARLKQIVTNLVRNAALHGCDPEHPRITIAPANAAADDGKTARQGMAAFQVHDNGPGIEHRLHRAIFLPGRRWAPRGAGGLGMGLAIVQKMAARFGGKVYVDPACSDGTSMVVVLRSAASPPGDSDGPAVKRRRRSSRRNLQMDPSHGEQPGQLHGSPRSSKAAKPPR